MEKALHVAECSECELRDEATPEADLQLAFLYNTYGVIKMQHGETSAAESWFRQVKELRQRHLNDADVLVIGVTMNLVLLLLNQMRLNEAIATLAKCREAIALAKNIPVRLESGIDDLLAEAHLFSGNYDEAWNFIQRSIEMTRQSVPEESQGSG
jgi:tetratricopeptide (TPR) repeat protein